MSNKNLSFQIILWVMTFMCTMACSHNKSDSLADENRETMMSLFRQGKDAAMKKEFHRSDSLGNALIHLADITDDDECRVRGLMCMSYSRIEMRDSVEQMLYLRQAEKILSKVNNDTLTAEFYNLMGVAVFLDFDRSKEYFAKSLYAARKIGSVSHQMMAECNLSEIYRCIGDTLGIRYDLDIYDFATRTGNEEMRHAAAVRCAEYYLKQPSTLPESMKYIEEIRNMPGKEFHYHYLMSKWLMATDSLDKAMTEWRKASETGTITPGFLLAGGRLYQHHGDYRKSESLLITADSAYSDIDSINTDRIEILRLRSENLRRLGRATDALEMLKRYQAARDSVSRLHSTRELNAFKARFDTEKKNLVIASQRAALRWRNILLCIAIAFIIAIISGFMLYIRRRNRLYRLIVEQQKDFATRQNEYTPYLREDVSADADKKRDMSGDSDEKSGEYVNEDNPQTVNASHNEDKQPKPENDEMNRKTQLGLPGREKADVIWRDILMEMEINRIYADPDVTRDMFACRVHTNHTWLTAIIKHRTGKSYTQFMNSWRINEAVRILSNPEATLNNKELSEHLGFMTPQSFYTAFRQQMGMSPSRFRSDALATNS